MLPRPPSPVRLSRVVGTGRVAGLDRELAARGAASLGRGGVQGPAGVLHGVHDPESGDGGTKRFGPVPTLGALTHHLEKVA